MRQAALCKQPLTAHKVFLMSKTTVVMLDADGNIIPKKAKKSSKKSDEDE